MNLLNIVGIAYANGVDGKGGASKQGVSGAFGFEQILLIVGMIAIFYFLIIRPQQKKEKDRKAMISQIKQGDRVLTAGGMYGEVASFKDEEIVVIKLADGSKAEFSRNAITMKVS